MQVCLQTHSVKQKGYFRNPNEWYYRKGVFLCACKNSKINKPRKQKSFLSTFQLLKFSVINLVKRMVKVRIQFKPFFEQFFPSFLQHFLSDKSSMSFSVTSTSPSLLPTSTSVANDLKASKMGRQPVQRHKLPSRMCSMASALDLGFVCSRLKRKVALVLHHLPH